MQQGRIGKHTCTVAWPVSGVLSSGRSDGGADGHLPAAAGAQVQAVGGRGLARGCSALAGRGCRHFRESRHNVPCFLAVLRIRDRVLF